MRRWSAVAAPTSPSRALVWAAALGCVTACALRSGRSGSDAAHPSGPGRGPVDPRSVGALVVLGIELPASGVPIGAHYQGLQFSVRQFDYTLQPAVRSAWAAAAQLRAEALVRGAGFRVRSVGPASIVTQRIEGVRFGIQGHVASLEVRSSGQFEPYLVEVAAEVSWEVLDLAYGGVMLGRTTRGASRLTAPLDSAVAVALDQSLAEFLGEGALAATLAAGRPSSDTGAVGRFTRPPPASDEIILLGEADLNPATETTPVTRVAHGIVSLRGPGGGYYGTAILLSRDGLGITTTRSARAVRGARSSRAQLYSGVERPVRVVRSSRTLGVALIQVACPGDCPTVDWDARDGVEASTPVLVVGAGAEGVGTLSIARGLVGGQWGLARGITLEAFAEGGEAVALADTGRVFGVAVAIGEQRVVMMLDDVLRALRVRPPAPPVAP